MTTITLPRAVVEQALEALKKNTKHLPVDFDYHFEALAALRAALAQQAEPPVDDPHRDHWVAIAEAAQKIAASTECGPAEAEALCAALDRLTAAALAQQAEPVDTDCHTQGICQRSGYGIGKQTEPVQEPVAEARYDGTLRWLEPHGVGLHRIQGPLYTASTPRKPLTEEEIGRLCDEVSWSPRQLARAIERAHGIGRQSDPQIEDRLARHGIPKP